MRPLIVSLLFAGCVVQGLAAGIAHPAMLHTQADLLRVKQYICQEPVRSAYIHLEQSQHIAAPTRGLYIVGGRKMVMK